MTATPKQIEFSYQLLLQHNYHINYTAELDKWTCECIIEVLYNRSNDPRFLDGLHKVAWSRKDVLKEALRTIEDMVAYMGCAPRILLLQVFTPTQYDYIKETLPLFHTYMYISRLSKETITQENLSVIKAGQAAFLPI